MAFQQSSNFLGVISKNDTLYQGIPPNGYTFKMDFGDKIRVFSNVKIKGSLLFDGFLYNVESLQGLNPENLEGNWAMAEIQESKVLLSRDRIGVRAMYYYENDDFFCFANEIKPLLQLNFYKFQVSPSAVYRFLVMDNHSHLVDGLFQEIKEIYPAHALVYECNTGSFKMEPYVTDTGDQNEMKNEVEAGNLIQNEIAYSVKTIIERCESGLGSMLSGGVDSSSIASALFIHNKQNEIPFITALTQYDELNEVVFAQSVVEKLNIGNWHQVVVQNFQNDLEDLHLAMELPTLSAGSLMQYEIMRFANHQGIHYLLDGTGADALFAGHNYYRAIYWNTLIRNFKISKLSGELKKYRGTRPFWLKYYIKNLVKYHYAIKAGPQQKRKLKLKQNPILQCLNKEFEQEFFPLLTQEKVRDVRNLNTFLKEDFYGGNVRRLLRFPDRIGRHFGVMNLPVFSDNRKIYEDALRIAPSLKIKNDQLKYILRYAFKDYLPLKVLNRNDKMGLIAPNNVWMKENKDFLISFINKDLEEYYDIEKMQNVLLKSIDNPGEVENYKIFKFLSFAVWFSVFKKFSRS